MKRDEYALRAEEMEQQAANIDQLQPVWSPQNRASGPRIPARRQRSFGSEPRPWACRAATRRAAAAQQLQKAGEIIGLAAYEGYGNARGWDAVAAFLKNPVEIATNIATEGMVGKRANHRLKRGRRGDRRRPAWSPARASALGDRVRQYGQRPRSKGWRGHKQSAGTGAGF